MASRVIEYILRLRDEASSELDEVADSADEAAEEFDDLGESAAEMGKMLVAAATAAAAAFAKLVKDLTDYKNAVNDMATRTGLAVSTLQGLDLAARGSGLTFEQLAAGLIPFSKRVADASRGVGEAMVAFDRLGISAARADGSMRDLDEVFRDSLMQLSQIADKGEQAALATQLFGRSGTMLLQALGDTSNLEEFEKLAAALGPDLVNASQGAADLQRALAEMETAALGAGDKLVSLFGGEAGVAALIEDFTLGLVFAAEFAKVSAENIISTFKILFSTLSDIWAAFKASFSLKDLLFASPAELQAAAERFGATLAKAASIASSQIAEVNFGGATIAATQAALDVRNARAALTFDTPTRAGTEPAAPMGAGGAGEDPWEDPPEQVERFVAALEDGSKAMAIFATSAATAVLQLAGDVIGSMAGLLVGDVAGVASSLGRTLSGGFRSVMGAVAGVAAAINVWAGAVVEIVGEVGGGIIEGLGNMVGMVSRIGELGAEGVEERLQTFQDNFIAGIEALPEILGEILPRFIREFAKALVPALMDFGRWLVRRLWNALRDPQWMMVLARTMVDFVFNKLRGQGRGGPARRGRALGDRLSGVVPNIITQRAAGGGMGNNITINGFVSSNGRDFARQLSNLLGANGLNLRLQGR